MLMSNTRGRIFWTAFALIIIVIGTAVAIRFAKGYRPSRQNIVSGNGLLVANSSPNGAQIFVNGRFTSATSDTLYLDPGSYDVEIKKDGFFTWSKKLQIEKEVVTQANGLLFPLAPRLTPLTFAGAQNVTPSPDGQRLTYYTASASAATKNGWYLLELTDSPLALQRGPKQIAEASSDFMPENTQVVWSPNSSQLLLISEQRAVLLDPSRLVRLNELPDVKLQLTTIFSQWEEEMYLRDRERLAKFPVEIQAIATASAVNVYFSPDEKQLLYTATSAFTLPENIAAVKPGSSSQKESRTTEVGGIYVYDSEEDRQFLMGKDASYENWLTLQNVKPTPEPKVKGKAVAAPVVAEPAGPKYLLSTDLSSPAISLQASPSAFTKLQASTTNGTIQNFLRYHTPLFSHGWQWFPTSRHLVTSDDSSITIVEGDSTNAVKVYSGPFEAGFVYPWPNGSRLIMLTNFNQSSAPTNLYALELR
jgi:hypothetical protein